MRICCRTAQAAFLHIFGALRRFHLDTFFVRSHKISVKTQFCLDKNRLFNRVKIIYITVFCKQIRKVKHTYRVSANSRTVKNNSHNSLNC